MVGLIPEYCTGKIFRIFAKQVPGGEGLHFGLLGRNGVHGNGFQLLR